MPNYSKLHDLVSHRVTIEYDTGARVTGYLASCQPSSGQVEFVVLSEAKMIDSRGRVLRELTELTLCPNVLTSIALDEGPRGRDVSTSA
jgi:small nuclear ribonucleoprotein (snRNP)-like protein